MPSWPVRVFFFAAVALYAAVGVALYVEQGAITALRQDIDRVDERLTRTHFLLYPVTP